MQGWIKGKIENQVLNSNTALHVLQLFKAFRSFRTQSCNWPRIHNEAISDDAKMAAKIGGGKMFGMQPTEIWILDAGA